MARRKKRESERPALPAARAAAQPTLAVCLGLAALIWSVYGQVAFHKFLNFDDGCYITANGYVTSGLSWSNVRWAFTTGEAANWHPLTWISHQIDVALFGVHAGAHHLMNVVWHTANTLLVFLILRRLTGAFWRPALVAALFAIHPLHVESVAWSAERKDVLSAFFGLLSIAAYAWYVERPGLAGWRRYLLAWLLLALGLMCKPMLVTWPAVFLVLDYWPLQRITWQAGFWRRMAFLAVEKAPFFALALASSVVTYFVQRTGGAMKLGDYVAFPIRVCGAVLSYAVYLYETVWPTRLVIFVDYWTRSAIPLSEGKAINIPGAPWQLALAAAVLAACTALAVWQVKRRPYIIAGWLWYLGTLVPVIGLVQVGGQAYADRYTYLPLIGIFWIVVWLGAEACDGLAARGALRSPAALAAALAALLIVALAATTCVQLRYWKNSIALFQHAVDVYPNSVRNLNLLGSAHDAEGDYDLATAYYQRALRIQPDDAETKANLARIKVLQGDYQAALAYAASAVQLSPEDEYPRIIYTWALMRAGRWAEAIEQHEQALKIHPTNHRLLANLGVCYGQMNRVEDAIAAFERALAVEPKSLLARINLAKALAARGRMEEAIAAYELANRNSPDTPEVLNNMAWLLATHPDPRWRRGSEAVQLAERLVRVARTQQANALDTLAAAYAAAGDYDRAVATAEAAIGRLQQPHEAYFRAQIEARLALYRQKKPYLEAPSAKDFLPPSDPPPAMQRAGNA